MTKTEILKAMKDLLEEYHRELAEDFHHTLPCHMNEYFASSWAELAVVLFAPREADLHALARVVKQNWPDNPGEN